MVQLTGGSLEGWLVSLLEGLLVALLTDGPLGGWLVGPLEIWLMARHC